MDKTLAALKSLAGKAATDDERNTLEWAMNAYDEAAKRREREVLAAKAAAVTREKRAKEAAARLERERLAKESEDRRVADLMDRFPVTDEMIDAAIEFAQTNSVYGGIERDPYDGGAFGQELTDDQACELYWAMRLAEDK